MASIYRKSNSPCWFIRFLDSEGKRRNKSTGLRTDGPGQTVKARALRARMEAKELSRSNRALQEGGRGTWVPQYLERHCQTARTLQRYGANWKWLALWLQIRRFHTPRAITYRTALEYIDWRSAYRKNRQIGGTEYGNHGTETLGDDHG